MGERAIDPEGAGRSVAMTNERWPGTIRVTDTPRDDAWDSYLEAHPHGHHIQTTRWAQVKRAAGWQAVRIQAELAGSIAGGAQVLYRPLRWFGNVGYVSLAPVVTSEDPEVVDAIAAALARVGRERRLRLLVVQEPQSRLRRSSIVRHAEPLGVVGQVVPRATVIIDVTQNPDDIRAGMKSRTRYNTKVGARKGVEITTGTMDDLERFHAMLERTALRQGFAPFSLEYFREMWKAFEPVGAIRLSFAEVDGDAVAAQVAVCFGETVVNKMSVWSGEAGPSRPNDALQWATICWAHENGYCWYDLEGIRPEAAAAVLEGRDPALAKSDSVTTYKLGYGGQVVLRPEPFVLIPNPALRFAYRTLYPRLEGFKWVRVMLKRLRVSNPSAGRRISESRSQSS